MGDRASSGNPLLRIVILAVFAATGIFVLVVGQAPQAWLEAVQSWRDASRDWIAAHPLTAALGYGLFYLLAVSVALPGALWFTVGAGFFLGMWLAVPVSLVGLTAGAVNTVILLRYVVGETLRSRLRGRVQRFADGFRRNDFTYVILLRVLPLPFFLVNLAAALLGARIGRFVAATLIGAIPSTLVYAGIGAGLGTLVDRGAAPEPADFASPAFIVAVLMVVLIAVTPVIYRWRSRQRLAAPQSRS